MANRNFFTKEVPQTVGTVVMMLLLWWAMILFGGAVTSSAQTGVTILSGPTVSSITETTAVVTWSTSVESTSVVYFGKTEAMGQVFSKIIPIEETEVMEISHSMTLWSLDPGTVYYYKVKSVTPGGATVESTQRSFVTASAVPECEEDAWSCGEWSECAPDGTQTRSCELEAECPTVDTPKPHEEQTCKYIAPEEPVEEETEPVIEPEPAPETEPWPAPEPTIEPRRPTDQPTQPRTSPGPGPGPTTTPEPEPAVGAVDAQKQAMQEKGRALSSALQQKGSSENMSDQMKQACGDAGVPEEMCYRWTSIKFSDKSCLEKGFVTAERCEAYLAGTEAGVFPGCAGLTDAECELVKKRAMAGYMSAGERAATEEVLAEAVQAGIMLAIQDITPVREDRTEGMRWRESFAEEGSETSSVVISLDSDGDGLPDQLEEDVYGSDPNEADSDGDGRNDSDEVAAGDDPTGEGELERELTPSERVLAEGRPIGQPRGAGEEDDGFTVEAIAPGGDDKAENGIVLSGTCDPGSVCLVYVYTYVPMVYVASTDAVGNFTVNLGDNIMDGDHTVYVALTDDTGKITRKSTPLSLFVREAVAVTEDDFLNPFAVQEEGLPMEEPVERYLRGYMIGAVVLVLLAFVLVWLMVAKKKDSRG